MALIKRAIERGVSVGLRDSFSALERALAGRFRCERVAPGATAAAVAAAAAAAAASLPRQQQPPSSSSPLLSHQVSLLPAPPSRLSALMREALLALAGEELGRGFEPAARALLAPASSPSSPSPSVPPPRPSSAGAASSSRGDSGGSSPGTAALALAAAAILAATALLLSAPRSLSAALGCPAAGQRGGEGGDASSGLFSSLESFLFLSPCCSLLSASPPSVVSALLAKCRSVRGQAPLSNADNMAFVGVLSTQLLWESFVRSRPEAPELREEQVGTRVNRSVPG